MAEGGFLVKFNGKEIVRCHTVKFDYDRWQYIINDKKKRKFPPRLKTVTIEIEYE